jgi:hypothetical protein
VSASSSAAANKPPSRRLPIGSSFLSSARPYNTRSCGAGTRSGVFRPGFEPAISLDPSRGEADGLFDGMGMSRNEARQTPAAGVESLYVEAIAQPA